MFSRAMLRPQHPPDCRPVCVVGFTGTVARTLTSNASAPVLKVAETIFKHFRYAERYLAALHRLLERTPTLRDDFIALHWRRGSHFLLDAHHLQKVDGDFHFGLGYFVSCYVL